MSRHQDRQHARKVPLNVTIDKALFDFIEAGMTHGIFQSRSHAINWGLQLLQEGLKTFPRTPEEIQRLEQQRREAPERNFR